MMTSPRADFIVSLESACLLSHNAAIFSALQMAMLLFSNSRTTIRRGQQVLAQNINGMNLRMSACS